jgi:hypothetical protein
MKTNVLVLGKSGSGKSSFLNFLWGEAVAHVDAGRPVTPKKVDGTIGIYASPPIARDGLDVVIHDSWGMEADKAEEWARLLTEESDKREQSDRIDDWFHTVIYCISAKGARVEDFEVESILHPLVDRGHRVAFVLTKCDIASREEIDGVRAVIESEIPNHGGIVEIGSRSQVLRGGRQTEAFGRESAFALIDRNFTENLHGKVRSQLIRRARNECAEWKREALAHYEETAGLFSRYATVLAEVNAQAQHRFEKMIYGLQAWHAQKNGEAKSMLSRFQLAMLDHDSHQQHFIGDKRGLLRGTEFEWDGAEVFTNVVMYLIPVVNLAYIVVGKDMHKDQLATKLDEVIHKLVERMTDPETSGAAVAA